MASAACLIRPLPQFRSHAMRQGLAACGYDIIEQPLDRPSPADVLLFWNRGNVNDHIARRYEQVGARVIVAENGYLGREWRDGYWYALSLGKHNGAGRWHIGGPERWDGWNVPLPDWSTGGEEIVVLAQRGIGQREIREPAGWPARVVGELRSRTKRHVRIRRHPGESPPAVTLADDLANAFACVTWSSGAALKAILMGVPVFYGCPSWIGASAALPVSADLEQPFRGSRLPMLRRLAWAMWNTQEIESGEPFRCLLGSPST